MNNDHLTGPMLSASMDEVIRLRDCNEALRAALRAIEIATDRTRAIASNALAPEQEQDK